MVIAIEVQKAFDAVLHKAVIQEFKQRRLRGRALVFMKSFLKDRHYEVQIGTMLGPKTPNNVGARQGSMLFPFYSTW